MKSTPCYSNRLPTFIGPFGYYASALREYEDGSKDYALSIWIGKFSAYFQVGKEWKFNCRFP